MSNRYYWWAMKKDRAPSDMADKFMLRMSEGMRDRIRVAAKRNNRSMNAEIMARLEESFSSGGIPEADPEDVEMQDVLSELEHIKLKIVKLRRKTRIPPQA
ncbi:Arc family DNA-binding protein [Rhizobium leucaenae]|uniref:Arc family DNA-binding protein n=1 Tax=Rhizobium leucaenae TaxID=29450 RepID=UPI000AA89BAA|nr:Arc family DNA-binding protein [Rhizobium leucaenae]